MALYKKIAGAADEAALAREASAAEDRYGTAPPAFRALLELARLRLLARALGVKALQRRGDELAATLEKDHALDPAKVVDLLKAGGARRGRTGRVPPPEGVRRRGARRRSRRAPATSSSPSRGRAPCPWGVA